MDGWVTIGTKLDSKQLERDLKNAKRRLEQFEEQEKKLTEQKIKIETTLEINETEYKQKIDALNQKYKAEIQANTKWGQVQNQPKIDAKYDQLRYQLEIAYGKSVDQNKNKLEGINKKLQENAHNQALVKNEVEETNQKLIQAKGYETAKSKIKEMGDTLKNLATKGDLKGISNKITSIGKSIQNITKKVLKWGLALFGIRAAYNLIRQSASAVLQYNDGLSNQVQFMKTVLATAIEPILKTVVSLVYTLLSYVNSIVKSLTGKDLFAQAKKNLQSGSKSAQEIKKQLAGFDEMNVLSDTSSSSAGSGFDTSGFVEENSKLLDILNKYKEMFMSGDWAGIGQSISQAIVGGLTGLAEKIKSIDWTGIGLKISEFLTNLDFSGILVALITVFGEAVIGFQNMMLAIDWPTILGNFGQAIADAIFKINEYINQIKWSDIGTMISDTFNAIPWGDIGSSILTTLWDSLVGLVDLFLGIDWGEVGETISDTVKQWIETITKKFTETDWKKLGEDIANKVMDFLENVDWIGLAIDILKLFGTGILAGWTFIGSAVTTLINRIKEKLEGLVNWFLEKAKKTWDDFTSNVKKVFGGLLKMFKGDFQGGLADIFNGLYNILIKPFTKFWNFVQGIGSRLFNFFYTIGVKAGDIFGGAFKGVINGVLGAIESILNHPIKQINKLINTINKVPGINLGKLSTFNLPRLAKGGIINQPGSGVMVGSAVAGERGREGVIPLTDSQQMALLGEAIGRYITVAPTIPVYVGNRMIAREIRKIEAEQSFATNS